jgi:hypothetical protein
MRQRLFFFNLNKLKNELAEGEFFASVCIWSVSM